MLRSVDAIIAGAGMSGLDDRKTAYHSIHSIDSKNCKVSHIQTMGKDLNTPFTYEWTFDWTSWNNLLNINKLYLKFEKIKECEVYIQSIGTGTNREARYSIPDSEHFFLELPSDLLSGNLNVVLLSNNCQDFLSGNWLIKKDSNTRDIKVSSVLYVGNDAPKKNLLWNIRQLSNSSNNILIHNSGVDLDTNDIISGSSNVHLIKSKKNGKRHCFQDGLLSIWNLNPKPDYILFADSSQLIQKNILNNIIGLLSNLKEEKKSCSFENKSKNSWFQIFPLISDISENLMLPMPIMQSNPIAIPLLKNNNNEKKGKLHELCDSC
ncbi:MAG: hypothetical protein B6241_13895 [Spirochaetaceae bacterium 4572_59]|nr:MAG: hypothetical protein B6241_13895 [Spirochaetaceae bacterium 4572_59]